MSLITWVFYGIRRKPGAKLFIGSTLMATGADSKSTTKNYLKHKNWMNSNPG